MSQMRSVLFAPAHEKRKVHKALAGDADCVVLDLEDAVPMLLKHEARTSMVEILSASPPRPGVFVRINGWGSSDVALQDLLALGTLPWVNVVVPMVEKPVHLEFVAHVSPGADQRQVIAQVETATGLRNLDRILTADSNLAALALGQVDLGNDLGIDLDRDHPVRAAASVEVVLAARSHNIEAIDGPWLDVRDAAGCEKDSRRSRDLGFSGRVLLHPEQVGACHRAFSPDPSQLSWATSIVTAFEAAVDEGRASLIVGNEFVDYPVYKRALRILSGVRS